MEILSRFWEGLLATTWLEFTAVFFGIASVVFSRLENIWVYPTGIVNTTTYDLRPTTYDLRPTTCD